MMQKNDLLIAAFLREDARIKLTTMARKTGMAVSTLFDHIHNIDDLCITRLCALLDFPKLGFGTRAMLLIKSAKDQRGKLREHLLMMNSVNSLMRINNGYDFLAECVFKDMRELEEFCEKLESAYGVKKKELHFIIEDLKREDFLGDPSRVEEVLLTKQ